MDVRITGVHGQGAASKEYVQMRVDRDCDIGNYVLADTTYIAPGEISNELRHMFWFPEKQVQAGDTIILRTGTGKNTEEEMDDGSTKHRFYWQLGSAVWNDTGDTAVLLRVAEWSYRKAR
jgi:hypothetical protein